MIMLMGACLMTYSVTIVGSIVGGLDKREVNFEQQMEILNNI